MPTKSNNLMLRYATYAFIGGLAGAFISQLLGYNDGSLQTYLVSALAASIGGSIGGLIRQRQLKQQQNGNTCP